MIKKYLGVIVLAGSVLTVGCSSSSDNADPIATTDVSGDVVGNSGVDTTVDTEGDTVIEVVDSTDNAPVVEAEPFDFGNSVMGIISAQPDLNLVEAAILSADGGLDQTLHDANNTWTVFAPNDKALDGIVADRDALLRHIHAGFQDATSLTGLVGSTLSMTGGAPQAITLADDGVTLQIGGVNIVQSGIVGDNGIVHKIDGVLQ